MRVRLTEDCEGPHGEQLKGTEIEHADAFRLCEVGLAEPLDDEAKAKFESFNQRRSEDLLRRNAKIQAKARADRAAQAAAKAAEDQERQSEFAKEIGIKG